MSALPLKADIASAIRMSALGQEATYAPQQNVSLFDHLVSGGKEVMRGRRQPAQ
jgi:hypothetical protein